MTFSKKVLLVTLLAITSPTMLMPSEQSLHDAKSGGQQVQPVNLNCCNEIQAAQSQENDGCCASEQKIVLGQRPQIVQEAVDRAFSRIKKATGGWLCNGGSGYYGLLGLDEKKIIKNLAITPGKDDVYLVDVGCAAGHWGIYVRIRIEEALESLPAIQKHFHIFSVTGGNECEEYVVTFGNVTLYQFNNFKIENIDEEFLKRGYDLKNKVNLMVSSWTLRHLVDPWGTLKRMYSLLKPQEGLLVSNGFLFALEGSAQVYSFPTPELSHELSHAPSWNILLNATSAIPLFRFHDSGRDTGEFLLMRNNNRELEIPLEYTGEIGYIGTHYQCASAVVTVFKKGLIQEGVRYFFKPIVADKPDVPEDGISEKGYCDKYCDQNNQASKDLYASFKKQGLFFKDFV